MTNPARDKINGLIADADVAIDLLNSTRREVCAEYNERIRKIRDLKISLHISRAAPGAELVNHTESISPELTRLLSDPTHGL
jgi:hypothetical protein